MSAAQISINSGPKIRLIWSKCESQSVINKGVVKIKCHEHFSMKYGHHPRQIHCTLTTLLKVIFTLRKGKRESLTAFFFVGCMVHNVSAR